MQKRRPVMLVILDGWGWREENADNAIAQAATPVFDRLWKECPHAFLKASGKDVGLPDGQMGNSEVGHLNIGAGRVVMQDLPRISEAVANGEIKNAPALRAFMDELKKSGGTCHMMGLLSPGGIHSHQKHAVGLAKILAEAKIPTVVHVFTDGRDTPPQSAAAYLAKFVEDLPAGVSIATVCGRYFAMDRDKRWDRVNKAYSAMVDADAPRFDVVTSVIAASYDNAISDEFVVPAVVGDYAGMKDGDGVLCFNFRADRVREILGAIVDPAFDGFARPRVVKLAKVLGMTHYSDDLSAFMKPIFEPQSLANGLGEIVAKAGRKQLRMAETEKYPHVTYFLNGGEEKQYDGEERILVPSPKVATYDLQPEMSAAELTDKAVAAIEGGAFDLIVLNYANPDMVGHTGILEAAKKAVETVDTCLGRIAAAVEKAGGAMVVIADHGNCEIMHDPATEGPHTAHTTNPVPLIVMGAEKGVVAGDGRLADVAPTLLALMELEQPAEMTGSALLR